MGFSTRSLAAGAAFLMVFGWGSQALAPPRSAAERGVRLALIRLNTLLSRRDSAVVDEFVAADDTLMIGAQTGERAQGIAQIAESYARMFEMPQTVTFAWREVDVSVRGEVAWLHADGEIVLKGKGKAAEQRFPYRLAGVLEPHDGRWKWRLFQGSQPVAAA
jgi:ketosteroid isomerase-like protein